MKAKFYSYACTLGLLLTCCGLYKGRAQCNCSPGVPATATVYTTSFTATTVYPPIEFPKFDPSTADLRCLTFNAVMDGTSTSTATATAGRDRYEFLLALTPRLQAPGINVSKTILRTYGPDSLFSQHFIDSAGYGQTSVTYGPEDIMMDEGFTSSVNGPSSYYTTNLATPVTVNFSISGGLTTTAGGANYIASVSTLASGTFTLTYYSCPLSPLATKMFRTTLKDNKVEVQWQTESAQAGSMYEVQVSIDGKNFKTVYISPAQAGNGINNVYQYLYNIGQTTADQLYFRIKETGSEGKVSYSRINTISLRDVTPYGNLGIYPNPATNKVSLQFDQEVEGKFIIDILNLMGQRVYNKVIQINRSNVATVELNNPPSSGMYYLRAADQLTGQSYMNKVYIK